MSFYLNASRGSTSSQGAVTTERRSTPAEVTSDNLRPTDTWALDLADQFFGPTFAEDPFLTCIGGERLQPYLEKVVIDDSFPNVERAVAATALKVAKASPDESPAILGAGLRALCKNQFVLGQKQGASLITNPGIALGMVGGNVYHHEIASTGGLRKSVANLVTKAGFVLQDTKADPENLHKAVLESIHEFSDHEQESLVAKAAISTLGKAKSGTAEYAAITLPTETFLQKDLTGMSPNAALAVFALSIDHAAHHDGYHLDDETSKEVAQRAYSSASFNLDTNELSPQSRVARTLVDPKEAMTIIASRD